jgi:ankyrin repeat protein
MEAPMAERLAALVEAVSKGEVDAAREMIDAHPELVRADKGGATPLHYAAIHGQRESVDLLIDRGADLEALDDEYGAAPIGWANEKGHLALVGHMRARGARLSLHMAAAFGFLEDVDHLARAHPEQVNLLVGYGAPLHLAALWGHAEVVERLLAVGADPSRRNQDGELAVTIAERQAASDACQTPLVTPDRRREIVAGCRRAAERLRAVTADAL